MSIKFEGSFDFAALNARLDGVMGEALTAGMEIVKADAIEKAPKESEHLVGTAQIRPDRGGDNTVGLTFDGPYARYQHENLEFHHPHGGQAKFEEMALIEKKDEALVESARVFREAL